MRQGNNGVLFKAIGLWISIVSSCMAAQAQTEEADKTTAQKVGYRVVTERLGTMSYKHIPRSFVLSEDACHMAVMDQRKAAGTQGLIFVVDIDGRPGPEYQAIDWESLAMSPNSKGVAYKAQKGDRWHVVYNGLEGPGYEQIGRVVLGSDGGHFAYVAGRAGKRFVVLDGREGSSYDHIVRPLFSPDGRRLAYVACKGDKQVVVVDDREGQEYDRIDTSLFSSNGRRFVYTALKGKRQVVVVDGREGPTCTFINEGPIFSPDGRRVVYVALKGEKWIAVIDGQEGPEYDLINRPIFSRDGKHWAYRAEGGGKCSLVIDGQEGPSYDGVIKIGSMFREAGDLEYLAYKDSVLYRVHCIPEDGRSSTSK